MCSEPKFKCQPHETAEQFTIEDIDNLVNEGIQRLFGVTLPPYIMLRAHDLRDRFLKEDRPDPTHAEMHDFAHHVVHYMYENGNARCKALTQKSYDKGVKECLLQ